MDPDVTALTGEGREVTRGKDLLILMLLKKARIIQLHRDIPEPLNKFCS